MSKGMNDASEQPQEPEPVPVLRHPTDHVHDIVTSGPAMDMCVETLASGEGPFAIDVERAGGYRYTQRAYLVQVRRQGAGTWLIDPLPFGDFGPLAGVLAEHEWVLHAANQDLPSLAELGLRAPALFDTELAGRLLGLPRVGLAAMTEHYLGYTLAKAHSAADWSTRPLPTDWLDYAALDVEPLLALRDHLLRDLKAAEREHWAHEEFDWVRNAEPSPPRTDPWRRVKGLSNRSPRALAIAREMWLLRDEQARSRDKAPSRVLPDSAIATVAGKPPLSADDLRTMPAFRRQPHSQLRAWHAAIVRAQQLPESDLPSRRPAGDSVPHPRSWERVNPVAANRLEQAKESLSTMAESLGIARENLTSPAALRDVIWSVSGSGEPSRRYTPTAEEIAALLRDAGARDWQVRLVADAVAQAISTADAAATTDTTEASPAVDAP